MENSDSKKWSSVKVANFLDMVENGLAELKKGPFYNNNSNYRKANIVFDYTREEIREISKCATDVSYFAEKYAHVMTDDGIRLITLRDYQRNILKGFAQEENRFNILLAARQVGKCFLLDTQVITKEGNKIYPAILYYELLKKEKGLTFLQKIKLKLYKLFISI